MGVAGNLYAKQSYLGETWQRYDQAQTSAYGKILFDGGTISDDGTTYSFTFTGGFWYAGYLNTIPFYVGYACYRGDTGDRLMDMTYYEKAIFETPRPLGSLSHNNFLWYSDISRTITRAANYDIGILPIIKIGGIQKYNIASDGTKSLSEDFLYGRDGDYFSSYEYGCTILDTESSGINGRWSETWDQSTKKPLDCWGWIAGKNDDKTMSYENCPIVIPRINNMPIYVYDSARKPQKAKGIWVYDANRKPQPAKSITIYGSGGSKTTITL